MLPTRLLRTLRTLHLWALTMGSTPPVPRPVNEVGHRRSRWRWGSVGVARDAWVALGPRKELLIIF